MGDKELEFEIYFLSILLEFTIQSLWLLELSIGVKFLSSTNHYVNVCYMGSIDTHILFWRVSCLGIGVCKSVQILPYEYYDFIKQKKSK